MRVSKSKSRVGLAKVMVFGKVFLLFLFQPFALEIIAKNHGEIKGVWFIQNVGVQYSHSMVSASLVIC